MGELCLEANMPTIIYKLFGFLNRLLYIDRWGLMYSTRKENVKEHSWDVAAIAHTLAVIAKAYFNGALDPAQAALYGIYHDASEAITGDMPTPVKYFSPEVKAASDKVEKLAISKMVSCLPAEMRGAFEEVFIIPDSYKPLVKAADRIAALAKCLEEKKRGNDEFARAEARRREELEETRKVMPEVGYFLDHFLPGYQLPLDALCEGNGSWIIDGDETN
jgi:5'-deoxynucleotidase